MVTLNAAAAARLRAELDHDLTQLARVRDQIAVRASATDETTTYALALLLMNYYTGVEKLLRRVALNFGGLPPAGERWHAGLLEGLTIDLPGLRPPLLRASTAERLADLLRFRHAVRHLYAWTIRRTDIDRLVTGLPALHDDVAADARSFGSFLDRLAATEPFS